ncbi:lipid transfer-like protein VAS [Canna indica]|uniref:Lipid transfer-like protein VAS n=1 Tax=Canna indica TaxID=4628 RepID=A0AAQ3KCB2_9LILI|nr:lipid transfer-like protein VAS [Canna indica]
MSTNFAAAAMVAVVAALTGSAAQMPLSCASNLVGRAAFINSTEMPPQSCCVPLKEAANNDFPYFYGLFNNTAILKAINVNIKQAIQMAKRYRVSADQSACQIAVVAPTINCNHSKLQAQLLLHRGVTSGSGARLLHRGSDARLLHRGENDGHSN